MALGNATHVITDGVCNPESRLLRIEVLVILTTVLLLFLFFFGSTRRRWNSAFMRSCIWTAYTLSQNLIPYTMGLMQSAPFHNQMFGIWALFFLYAFGSVNSISAYSLEGNLEGKTYAFQVLVQVVYAVQLLAVNHPFWLTNVQIWVLFSASFIKIFQRLGAFQSASRSSGLVRNTRVVADFMTYEHELSGPGETDPTVMRGYKYLVDGERKAPAEANPTSYVQKLKITDEVITVEKIWECKGRLLTSVGDPDGKLKDICLSFAWFKMLKRRFTGYQLPECHLPKTWDLIDRGFLSNTITYERAFRVTEVELQFLYDAFFTKYEAVFEDIYTMTKIVTDIVILLWILGNAVIAILALNHATKNMINIDVLITNAVLIVIFALELLEFGAIMISDWMKVFLICRYVQKPSRLREKAVQFVFWLHLSKPWQRKIGQYSLLESFNHYPPNLLCLMTIGFVDKTRKGQKASRSVNLPEEVKSAVIRSLETNGRQLSNGQSSLKRNQMEDDLSWACNLETHTHSILVWHIATSFCEIAPSQPHTGVQSPERQIEEQPAECHTEEQPAERQREEEQPAERQREEEQPADRQREEEHHRLVATSLSRYCAYLVAFVPVLLPDHAYTTELIFDKVIREAREILEECRPKSRLYENMMKIDGGNSGGTIIGDGVKLGKQLLEIQDQGRRWKVLADYWAEMMLFIAPSDNATAHAENLANGGEFITHLWAFLTHAGILDRNTPPARRRRRPPA
ncbi:uncharacterized protein LOC131220065 [Magnolia sinica]|uniref:uncharacterized protein LOC131220065 n=1 Tax=Magnolia sinica TaxID=86752 RepID=UPI002658B3A5|nr:uncharacterized protein LOC131220065 [Magnolia sinica]